VPETLARKNPGFLLSFLHERSMRDESWHTENVKYRQFLDERDNFIGDLVWKLKESTDR
jgi:hypothetical protein